MTIALWCLFIAAQLHFITKLPLGKAQAECEGGYNNNSPREQQASLDGWGKRALGVHQNQIESFPFFAAGILVPTALGLSGTAIDALAITYVVSRFVYMFCYLKDLATLRSTIWGIGITCSFALMCSPAWL